ncbi:hypothetical protein MYX76_03475 [Desulfobacterota bacterium AH_259_B03_O07]|nr:hypothetical protein [Desulfobacterota bacterium AH_259_B03_O07]
MRILFVSVLVGLFLVTAKQRRLRTMKKFILGCLVVAILLPTSAVFALEKQGTYNIHFGWYAVGKVFEIGKDHGFFAGEFSGTVFNDEGKGFLHHASVVCPGVDDVIKGISKAHGYCTITDFDGDMVFLVWKCKGSKGSPKCEGDFQWTGGTGKYTGIKGNNNFYGVHQNITGPTPQGYSIWWGEWKLP